MSDDNEERANGGIWITEGNTFRLSGLTITINEETGEVSATGGEPHLHYDVAPVWLSIALDHLRMAKVTQEERMAIQSGGVNDQVAQLLEREFRASMQAITSAAISIDAFYGVLKSKLPAASEPDEPQRR